MRSIVICGVIVAVILVLIVLVIYTSAISAFHRETLSGAWSANEEFCKSAGVTSITCIISRQDDKYDTVFAISGETGELNYSVGRITLLRSAFWPAISRTLWSAEHETMSGQSILPARIAIEHDIIAGKLEIRDAASDTVYARMHKE